MKINLIGMMLNNAGRRCFDDAILENGKPVKCARNIAQMGFWRTLWNFYSDGYYIGLMVIFDQFMALIKAVSLLVATTVIYPIAPFLEAYLSVRQARREVSKKESKKMKNLNYCFAAEIDKEEI